MAGADALVTLLHDRVDGAVLDAAGAQLKVVANVAVGYDNIDVAAAARRGVAVTNAPGVLTDATPPIWRWRCSWWPPAGSPRASG